MRAIAECFLYGIIDLGYVRADGSGEMAKRLVAGGADIIQLRAKDAAADEIVKLGRVIRGVTEAAGVPLIINDRPELVPDIGAQGVHVGQDDCSIEDARDLAGPGAIVGKSTHSLAQAAAAAAEGADYIGFGPIFATPTKPDYQPIGTADIAEAHRQVRIPIFCIGGVKNDNLKGLAAMGARRVVIVSALLKAEDPEVAAREAKAALAPSYPENGVPQRDP